MLALWRSLLGAIVFYTVIPLPPSWPLEVTRVARWAPVVGLGLGGLLAGADVGLSLVGLPVLTRSAVLVALWVALSGGLHLDGAMDTADGLAVGDRSRRLEVMRESTVGAFGAIAAIVVLGLKVAALSDINALRGLALTGAAGWGRLGQVVAIACYPYLRAQGKGKMHRDALQLPQDLLLGAIAMSIWSAIAVVVLGPVGGLLAGGGLAIALLIGAYFYWQLGGHTGDTYGAVVEWTEAIALCLFTLS